MNRWALLALTIGLVGIALAAELPDQEAADEAEVADLPPEQERFDHFCKETRNRIMDFGQINSGSQLARVIRALVGSVFEASAAEVDSSDKVAPPAGYEWLEQSVQSYSALGDKVLQDFYRRLQLLKPRSGKENLKETLAISCAHINHNLMHELIGSFERLKLVLVDEYRRDEQFALMKQVEKVEFEDLKCLSIGRLHRIIRACGYLAFAGPLVYPKLNL